MGRLLKVLTDIIAIFIIESPLSDPLDFTSLPECY